MVDAGGSTEVERLRRRKVTGHHSLGRGRPQRASLAQRSTVAVDNVVWGRVATGSGSVAPSTD